MAAISAGIESCAVWMGCGLRRMAAWRGRPASLHASGIKGTGDVVCDLAVAATRLRRQGGLGRGGTTRLNVPGRVCGEGDIATYRILRVISVCECVNCDV